MRWAFPSRSSSCILFDCGLPIADWESTGSFQIRNPQSGRRNIQQNAFDDVVRFHPLGFRFVGEEQAVTQNIRDDLLDVLGQHEPPPLNKRARSSSRQDADAGSRRSSETYQLSEIQMVVFRIAGGKDDVENIGLDAFVHVDLRSDLPHPIQALWQENFLEDRKSTRLNSSHEWI